MTVSAVAKFIPSPQERVDNKKTNRLLSWLKRAIADWRSATETDPSTLSYVLVPMLQSLFRGQFIIMHNLQELAHNRPIIPMEHFLEQVAWPEAQLPLVIPNEAAPPEPTPVQVDPGPATPQSPVVNPPSSPKRKVVPHLHL